MILAQERELEPGWDNLEGGTHQALRGFGYSSGQHRQGGACKRKNLTLSKEHSSRVGCNGDILSYSGWREKDQIPRMKDQVVLLLLHALLYHLRTQPSRY